MQAAEDLQVGEVRLMGSLSSIHGSVGQNGKNSQGDVLLVQRLLKTKGFSPGPVDGVCGAKTIAAIRRFQQSFLRNPDGLIQPGHKTWLRLANPTVPAPPNLALWSGDSSRWSQNKKIASMKPELRPKVQAVVDALAKRDFKPKVFFGWRSVAVQLKLYEEGNSTVKFSFHNAQKPDGTPNSYAADIIDERYGWNDEAQSSGFWKALGEEAKAQQLYWGGDWASFRDWAHVQLVPNSELARVKKESGL